MLHVHSKVMTGSTRETKECPLCKETIGYKTSLPRHQQTHVCKRKRAEAEEEARRTQAVQAAAAQVGSWHDRLLNAVLKCSSETLQTVLQAPERPPNSIDLKCQLRGGKTALHLAVLRACPGMTREARKELRDKLVHSLLHAGANPHETDCLGRTCFLLALSNGCVSGALMMLDPTIAVCQTATLPGEDIWGKTPLTYAGEAKTIATGIELLEGLLRLASPRNPLSDIDGQGNTILHSAAACGNAGTVQYIIGVAARDEDLLRALLSSRGDRKDCCTPLLLAAGMSKAHSLSDYPRTLQLLLDAGADINCVSHSGCDILWLAVEGRNWAAVKFLRERLAPVGQQRLRGFVPQKDLMHSRTALHKLLANDPASQDHSTVHDLLALGADPAWRDDFGMQPRDYATDANMKSLLDMASSLQLASLAM